MSRNALATVAAVALAALMAGCGSSSSASTPSSVWSTAASAKAGGGMTALVAAAQAEGRLNVIALPSGWVNYSAEIRDFTEDYGIRVYDEQPSDLSAAEIAAIKRDGHERDAPDVVDIGQYFASRDADLFAPYKVATWKEIPAANKDPQGNWFGDYGGYISFGCDLALVRRCPDSWTQLAGSAYRHDVALTGTPGRAGGATAAVQAAALNSGGSFADTQPGLTFFTNLKRLGNFNSTACNTAALIEAGKCPILIDWDFLNVAGVWGLPPAFKWVVRLPSGVPFAQYNDQAINKDAPDPAAARLWEEFLYSAQGQNNFLKGYARPVELAAMVRNGTVDQAAYARLPPLRKVASFPTGTQEKKATVQILAGWGK